MELNDLVDSFCYSQKDMGQNRLNSHVIILTLRSSPASRTVCVFVALHYLIIYSLTGLIARRPMAGAAAGVLYRHSGDIYALIKYRDFCSSSIHNVL